MTSDQPVHTPMFTNEPEIGLVLSGLRRYNFFTTAYFLGRQHRLLSEFADHVEAGPGEHALDIGCGTGRLVRILGRRVGPDGSSTGIDPSVEAIEYNERRDTRNRYLCSPAQEIPLPDAAFDLLTCTFVMHHIPEQYRESALAEMWRVLRPGGRLLLADAHFSDRTRAMFARLARRRKGERKTVESTDIRRYSAVLREIGFEGPEFVATGHATAALLAVRPLGQAAESPGIVLR